MGRDMVCDGCHKDAANLRYEGNGWYCRLCHVPDLSLVPYFREGGDNPINKKATKAHINDVRDRRWDPKEKRTFYYSKEAPKTYFFPKG